MWSVLTISLQLMLSLMVRCGHWPSLTLVSLLTPMVLGTWSEATGVGRSGDGVGVTVFIGTFGISGTKRSQNK